MACLLPSLNLGVVLPALTKEDGGEGKVCLQAGEEVGLAKGLMCLGKDSG